MRLVMATDDLVIEGRSFSGFPLLLDSEGWPLEPAQSFLWHRLAGTELGFAHRPRRVRPAARHP